MIRCLCSCCRPANDLVHLFVPLRSKQTLRDGWEKTRISTRSSSPTRTELSPQTRNSARQRPAHLPSVLLKTASHPGVSLHLVDPHHNRQPVVHAASPPLPIYLFILLQSLRNRILVWVSWGRCLSVLFLLALLSSCCFFQNEMSPLIPSVEFPFAYSI